MIEGDDMRKLIRGVQLLFELTKYWSAWICGKGMQMICKEYRNIWLIGERGREARDNGYHFFSYMTKQHPDVNSWYVADPSLPDYERVQKLGNTMEYQSWKHYMMCAVAKVRISTHIMGFMPDIEKYYMLDKVHVVPGKNVFLQHGIIKEDLPWLHYPNVKPNLFICSVPIEAEFVEKTFKYPKGIIKCTGMCRFDALVKEHIVKKQILVMPTWRAYIVNDKNSQDFLETDYYQQFQQLLKDEQLKHLLEEYDFELVFYPHYEIQKFISAFSVCSDRMKIGKLGEYDVQQLLMESSILITDYSSVYFDFAYMEKPVVYFQFDQDKYYERHYQKGYFDCERDGFGPVVTDRITLLNVLEEMLENSAKMDIGYSEKCRQFFREIDDKNCERNYKEIIGLLERK